MLQIHPNVLLVRPVRNTYRRPWVLQDLSAGGGSWMPLGSPARDRAAPFGRAGADLWTQRILLEIWSG